MSIKDDLFPFLQFISTVSEDQHAVAQVLSDVYRAIIRQAETLGEGTSGLRMFAALVNAINWRSSKQDPDTGEYYKLEQTLRLKSSGETAFCSLHFGTRADCPEVSDDQSEINALEMQELYGKFVKKAGNYEDFLVLTEMLIGWMLKDWVVVEAADPTYAQAGISQTVDGRPASESPMDELLVIYFSRRKGATPTKLKDAVLMVDFNVVYKAITESYIDAFKG